MANFDYEHNYPEGNEGPQWDYDDWMEYYHNRINEYEYENEQYLERIEHYQTLRQNLLDFFYNNVNRPRIIANDINEYRLRINEYRLAIRKNNILINNITGMINQLDNYGAPELGGSKPKKKQHKRRITKRLHKKQVKI